MIQQPIAPRLRDKTVNLPAERNLLGSLLLAPDMIEGVVDLVAPEDFYFEAHALIYRAMAALHSRHETPYLELVESVLRRQGIDGLLDLDSKSRLDTFEYLVTLEENAFLDAEYAATCARRIAFLSQMRHLGRVSEQLRDLAESGEEDALEQAEHLVLSVGARRSLEAVTSLGAYFPTYIQHLTEVEQQQGEGRVRGVPTGYGDLDALLGGLQPGGLYVIGAQSRIGKTTLCQNILYNAAAKYGKRGGMFSCEMNLDELMDRFIAIHTARERRQPLNSQDLRTATLSDGERTYLIGPVQERFESLGIYAAETPGIRLDSLMSRARRLVKQERLDLLVVDYLQLITVASKRNSLREQEVAEIARSLKILAGELHIPIIAPAQLSREVERQASTAYEGDLTGDTFKIPQLWHLRESGEIEQSANVVMFLARAEKREHESHVKLVVAKHRSGPEGDLDLYFEGKANCFYPLSERGNI